MNFDLTLIQALIIVMAVFNYVVLDGSTWASASCSTRSRLGTIATLR